MRICVYGSASTNIDNKYVEETEKMGKILADRDHNLVFGGGGNGLMGAAARGFRKGGAHILGVIPRFFVREEVEEICDICDELVTPETMRERKLIMEDMADAFIVTPGGIGTLEEFFEILTLKQLCRHNKPIALYDQFGYYTETETLIKASIEKMFIKDKCKELYFISDNLDEIIEYIETPVISQRSVKELKDG
ncbi:MAG: TIGR00730 family Rossman fold protein [Clostridia bacterium]|nr:TIGR00730 family Rossman fold protein [Clostridia bacterium]